MKKIITIIFCLLVSTTIMGQDCLTFMGIPTKGGYDYITKQLEAKGFENLKSKHEKKWMDYYKTNYGDNWEKMYKKSKKDSRIFGYREDWVYMQGMFCGELCEVHVGYYGDFSVRTHRHNFLSKERAKKMYKSFKKYYNSKTLPSLSFWSYGTARPVEISVVNKEGDQIGIVKFEYTDNQVFITYNNTKKPEKTFHKCDEHCDGYWMEELVSVK